MKIVSEKDQVLDGAAINRPKSIVIIVGQMSQFDYNKIHIVIKQFVHTTILCRFSIDLYHL